MRADQTARWLREWARGSLPMGAGVELILRAFDGRFARPSWPWIVVRPDGQVWIDTVVLRDHTGALSGGERRVLATVAALLDEAPLDVVDVVTGLDRANLHLVLAALAHAAGSHEHPELVVDPDGIGQLSLPGAVVAWPA